MASPCNAKQTLLCTALNSHECCLLIVLLFENSLTGLAHFGAGLEKATSLYSGLKVEKKQYKSEQSC
jgi:hypothetical protein